MVHSEYQNKILNVFEKISPNIKHNTNSVCILGDSLETLRNIKNNKIDLVFADPPYNIGKIFGKNKEKLSKEDYLNWCKKWISECMRILKPTGTLCFMAATQFMPYLDSFVDTNYSVISRVVWTYDSSGVQAKKSFGSMYEPIVIVAKDKKKFIFNSKAVQVKARTGAERKLIDYRKTPPQQYKTMKVMGNVWNISRVRFKMDEYESHPAQKPEKLLDIIIKALSNEGGIVLDPFAGTFTTCAIAQKNNRKNIGIEIEEEYYEIGLRRLNLAKKYNGKKLIKIKRRLTKNKSKKDHLISNSTLK